jgi:hypothetical protein
MTYGAIIVRVLLLVASVCLAQGPAMGTAKAPASHASIPASAIKSAGSKCDAAFGAEADFALPQSHVLTLYQDERSRSPWNRKPGVQATGLEAGSSSDLQTVACIRSSQYKVGDYRGETGLGPSAYAVQWQIKLVRWSDGAVIGGKTLIGSQPPERHAGIQSVTGKAPTAADYTRWLRSRLFPVLLPVTKLQVQMPVDSKWTVSALEDRDRLQNAAGVMVTVSIQPTSSHRQCVDILKAVAATSGGKLVWTARYADTQWHPAMEAGEMTSLCGEFPLQNIIVLAGPLAKVNQDSDGLRLLLHEIHSAAIRQLRDNSK